MKMYFQGLGWPPPPRRSPGGGVEWLTHHGGVVVLAADGQENLADLHAGAGARGPAEGAAHALLKPISSSARKHLIDAQDVEGVHSDAQVEGILASELDLYSKTQ